eukprot:3763553-Ditylum_brightwellii.AAC.1
MVKQAPPESMVQLGQSIQRIVAVLADHHNLHHPFQFAKLDVKDGFWWLIVNKEDAWNFCYVLPPQDGQKITNLDKVVLVVSLSIQMGWAESPPYFCTSSETSRDVMQHLLDVSADLSAHKFEHYMIPQQANHLKRQQQTCWRYLLMILLAAQMTSQHNTSPPPQEQCSMAYIPFTSL